MASYVVPQVEIHQLFSEIPASLQQNQVAFVFGPNYLLHRYSDTAEKTKLYVGEYDSQENGANYTGFYAYPGAVLDAEKIEKSYTKVFADEAYVETVLSGLVSVEDDESSSPATTTTDRITVSLSAKEGISEAVDKQELYESIAADLDGLYLGVKENDLSAKGTVHDHYDRIVLVTKAKFIGDELNPLFELVIDEEITIDPEASIGVTVLRKFDHIEITRNCTFDPEKSFINWEEKKSGRDMGIKLNAAGVQLKLDLPHIEYVESKYGIAYSKLISVGTLSSADLYIECRELSTAASDTIHSLTYASEVANALGAVTPDNPLAQAVYNAALNSGGQIVRYMAIPSDDEDGWNAVLNAASLTKEVYFLVPVTRDEGLLELVQSHVNDMSEAHTKRWRVAFVSAEVPDIDPIYTAASSTSGREFNCRVTDGDMETMTARVEFVIKDGESWIADPDTRFKKDLKVNDILYTNKHTEWDEEVFAQYRIVKIVNNYTVIINVQNEEELDALTEKDPMVAEVYHPYTNAEKADVIKNISSAFADRRMYNVFPSEFVTDGVLQSGEFAAACVAGLVSSCLPQQPVTNLELVGINDIPLVYQTFSFDQLNTMASGGTFIVMQDLPNDQVYVRHQISTAYEDNNLNTAELSITKNLDSISYFFDDLLSPYIGKYNITPELLVSLRSVINGGISELATNNFGLYGSQVILDGTEIKKLEQDALLKDHVNCDLQLNLPYPFNHLVLKLFV